MQKFDIHLCLVSEQAAPNYLPITDPKFKPKEAVFLVGKGMEENAEFLEKAFVMQQVKVKKYFCEDSWGLRELNDVLFKILEDYEDKNIALNLTGGTKLMALVAQSLFKDDTPTFYFNNNQLLFLKGEESAIAMDLNCNVNINGYLTAYGETSIRSSSKQIADSHLELSEYLGKRYNRFKNALPVLNGLASETKPRSLTRNIDNKKLKINALVELLEYFKACNLIDFYQNTIEFKSEEDRFFLNGGWLETYAFNTVNKLKKEQLNIQDIQYNLEVGNSNYDKNKSDYKKDNLGNKNELDVTFIANNKLYIIECKTSLMKDNKEVSAILDKLEVLKKKGGRETKAALVTFHTPPQAILNKAKNNKIKIISAGELEQLSNKIKEWINE
ncbi:Card1-like endonuclease domain-containing protein [Phocoenobacter atlanticus]|uniref:Card1-like endonuclease domain-containing protein n=1 Tax=Phocoenobacter atlanticus TaxID=3416742 RepID=UPI002766A28C|nr:DUF1887 family CARF protein [Pasteurella atlantica]MDP8101359.1 DUF1887 family CARF protein [Pasteurella atlantica]